VKYIVVARDARDVFMSWWNHYSNYKDKAYEDLNNTPGRQGDPMPRCPEDIREYWKTWMTRGWFEWENEGYPHSGNLYHTRSWWECRHLENILFVHFNDLLEDLEREIACIARFMDINVSKERISAIAGEVNFHAIKRNPRKIGDPERAAQIWEGGINIFINKGTNGRWKEILTTEDLNLYDEQVNNLLEPECRRWLENGSKAGVFNGKGFYAYEKP
jgi:aryl sulfotransferase